MAASRSWLKFTKWNCAGFTVDLSLAEPLFLPSTPLQYFRRLILQNEVFGDSIELVGLQKRGFDRRIVTSQPDVAGDAPSLNEIDRRLCETEGFRRLNIPPMGYYKSASYLRSATALFDVHPANCVLDVNGKLIPIDFIVVELTPAEMRSLESG